LRTPVAQNDIRLASGGWFSKNRHKKGLILEFYEFFQKQKLWITWKESPLAFSLDYNQSHKNDFEEKIRIKSFGFEFD
jgi:hypothetical protein